MILETVPDSPHMIESSEDENDACSEVRVKRSLFSNALAANRIKFDEIKAANTKRGRGRPRKTEVNVKRKKPNPSVCEIELPKDKSMCNAAGFKEEKGENERQTETPEEEYELMDVDYEEPEKDFPAQIVGRVKPRKQTIPSTSGMNFIDRCKPLVSDTNCTLSKSTSEEPYNLSTVPNKRTPFVMETQIPSQSQQVEKALANNNFVAPVIRRPRKQTIPSTTFQGTSTPKPSLDRTSDLSLCTMTPIKQISITSVEIWPPPSEETNQPKESWSYLLRSPESNYEDSSVADTSLQTDATPIQDEQLRIDSNLASLKNNTVLSARNTCDRKTNNDAKEPSIDNPANDDELIEKLTESVIVRRKSRAMSSEDELMDDHKLNETSVTLTRTTSKRKSRAMSSEEEDSDELIEKLAESVIATRISKRKSKVMSSEKEDSDESPAKSSRRKTKSSSRRKRKSRAISSEDVLKDHTLISFEKEDSDDESPTKSSRRNTKSSSRKRKSRAMSSEDDLVNDETSTRKTSSRKSRAISSEEEYQIIDEKPSRRNTKSSRKPKPWATMSLENALEELLDDQIDNDNDDELNEKLTKALEESRNEQLQKENRMSGLTKALENRRGQIQKEIELNKPRGRGRPRKLTKCIKRSETIVTVLTADDNFQDESIVNIPKEIKPRARVREDVQSVQKNTFAHNLPKILQRKTRVPKSELEKPLEEVVVKLEKVKRPLRGSLKDLLKQKERKTKTIEEQPIVAEPSFETINEDEFVEMVFLDFD